MKISEAKYTYVSLSSEREFFLHLITDESIAKEAYLEGVKLYEVKKFNEAKYFITEAIELSDNLSVQVSAYNLRGIIKCNQKKFYDALNDFYKALTLETDALVTLHNIGYAESLRGENDRALESYGKALEINPKSERTLISRASLNIELGNYVDAIKDYDVLVQLNPEDSRFYIVRGCLKGDISEYQSSLVDFEKAVKLGNSEPVLFYNRAITKNKLGLVEEALSDYNHILKLNPTHFGARVNRAIIRSNKGDIKGAVSDFKEIIKTDPDACENIIILIKEKYSWAREEMGIDDKNLSLFNILSDEVFRKLLFEDEGFYEKVHNNLEEEERDILYQFSEIVREKDKEIASLQKKFDKFNRKKSANEYAYNMVEPVKEALEKGYTSTRKMAKYFNELGLKTREGKDFRASSIMRLRNRQAELGYLKPEDQQSTLS